MLFAWPGNDSHAAHWLKFQVRETWMVVGTPSKRPVVFPVGLADGKVVDAGDAAAHESVLVEFPVLIAIGAEPVAGVVVPLVGKTHGDAVAAKEPKLFDEAVIQFLVPLAGEELHD